MGREHLTVRGRDEELAAVREALAGDGGRLVVVRGAVGIGRSALLEAVSRDLVTDGLLVVATRFGEDPDDGADVYGLRPLTRAVRDRFAQFGDLRLANSLNAVARLQELTGREPDSWTPSARAALSILFDTIVDEQRIAILADDAQAVAEPALLLATARQSGCLVLAGVRDEAAETPGTAELATVADAVISVGPLAEEHTAALANRVAGAPLDESVLSALRTALGPLFGNPGTVTDTVAGLCASGRLVFVRDRLCLRAPHEPIALPADHHLVVRATRSGQLAERLLGAVAAWDEFTVDDLPLLAGAIGAPLSDCGHALDRLVAAGVLAVEGRGRVRCWCAGLAAFALERLGATGREALHGAIAGTLSAMQRAGGSVDPALLADHIVRAGTSLVVDDATTAWMLDLADTVSRNQPARAARWYVAVLCRWRPDEPRYGRVLADVVALVCSTGQYELLSEVLARSHVGQHDPATLTRLRLTALVAATHAASPPSGPNMRALLREPADSGESLLDSAGLQSLLSADQADLLDAALSADPATCAKAWRRTGRAESWSHLQRLCEASSQLDLATASGVVLGTAYKVPEHGVLGAYRRAVRGYTDANWSLAMSAVRELELSGSGDTVLHHAGRLIAADICAGRGQYAAAAAWLADARPLRVLAAWRARVQLGLCRDSDQVRSGVRVAWQCYRQLRDVGERSGLEWLLLRAVHRATHVGDHDMAVEILDEIESLHYRGPCATSTEVLFLARGMVHGCPNHFGAGIELARRRGADLAVMYFSLEAARSAPDPEPLLNEAYTIAVGCESPLIREQIRLVVRARGVAAPRVRGRRERLTGTRQRIVELLRDGLTNRQIAAAIRVSEKAVETHLTQLFSLTGCRSRVELAAASFDGRLVEFAL